MTAFSCLFLLVISTITTVSTVISLASKHFYSFAHCPYHTRSTSIVAYQNNTCCPHHFKPKQKVFIAYLTFCFSVAVSPSLLPWDLQEPLSAPPPI